jgi:hypothetical protein
MALRELALRSPEEALARLDPGKTREMVAATIGTAHVIAKSNPDLLKEWIRKGLESCPPDSRGIFLESGLQGLSSVDAAGAFAFCSQLKLDPTASADAISAIFGNYGRQDPAGAQSAAGGTFSGRELDSALRHIALGASDNSPEVALDIALKITNASGRNDALGILLDSWIGKDAAAATEKLKSLDPKIAQASLSGRPSIVTALARKSPEDLTTILGGIVATGSNQAIFDTAVRALSINSPEHAFALIDSMPEGEVKSRLVATRFSVLAQSNPSQALKMAADLSDENARTKAYGSIAAIAGAQGLDATLKLAESLPSEDGQRFLQEAMPSVIAKDPKVAADFLADPANLARLDAARKGEIIPQLAARLAGGDPAQAKEWLASLPAEDQPRAMEGIAREMARSDIRELSEMLGSAPKDRNWEAGVRELIRQIQESDREMAKQWQDALTAAGFGK